MRLPQNLAALLWQFYQFFLVFINTIIIPVIINASFVYISLIDSVYMYILRRSASSLAQTEIMHLKISTYFQLQQNLQ